MRVVSLAAVALVTAPLFAQDPLHPNIVLILADDLGWTDLGCQGSDFYRTPHLDALAREGVRCRQAYSACTVCSPSRAALLTGQHPARLQVTDWIPGCGSANKPLQEPAWRKHLPSEVHILPELLKSAGYRTGIIGKWHLGGGASAPDQRGFDAVFGAGEMGGPSTYFSPYHLPHVDEGPQGEYLTERLGREAVRFLQTAPPQQPFFLYLAHYAVHLPLQAPADAVADCAARVQPQARHQNPTYAAMVEALDRTVGDVLTALELRGLAASTLVIVTSDNGGVVEHFRERPATGMFSITSNAPARGGKGMPWDGGVRVPLLARWPGHLPAGRLDDTPSISMDLFSTVMAAAHVQLPAQGTYDGINLLPHWTGQATSHRDTLYWHYPHYHAYGATPYSALRWHDWRLLETFEDQHLALYDLHRDPGETQDVAKQFPDVTAELHQRLIAWRKDVGAQLPTRTAP